MTMKILILTEGGKDIGFGHLTRCMALSQALYGMKGKSRVTFVINGCYMAEDFLKRADFNAHIERFDWRKENRIFFDAIKNYDVVVIDSYLADRPLYYKIFKSMNSKKKLVMFDDYNRITYPPGIIVNPSIYGNAVMYPKRSGRVYLTGKNYVILRREFWNTPIKKINKEIKHILITCGGMDHSVLIYKIMTYFKKKNYKFIFHAIGLKKNKVNAQRMRMLMLKTDVCISGGGQTTYELARCGVPTIGICFADNQLINIRRWTETGFLEFAGWYYKESLFKKIEKALIKVSNYKKRIEINRIGRKFVDGQGAKRVAREILK